MQRSRYSPPPTHNKKDEYIPPLMRSGLGPVSAAPMPFGVGTHGVGPQAAPILQRMAKNQQIERYLQDAKQRNPPPPTSVYSPNRSSDSDAGGGARLRRCDTAAMERRRARDEMRSKEEARLAEAAMLQAALRRETQAEKEHRRELAEQRREALKAERAAYKATVAETAMLRRRDLDHERRLRKERSEMERQAHELEVSATLAESHKRAERLKALAAKSHEDTARVVQEHRKKMQEEARLAQQRQRAKLEARRREEDREAEMHRTQAYNMKRHHARVVNEVHRAREDELRNVVQSIKTPDPLSAAIVKRREAELEERKRTIARNYAERSRSRHEERELTRSMSTPSPLRQTHPDPNSSAGNSPQSQAQ